MKKYLLLLLFIPFLSISQNEDILLNGSVSVENNQIKNLADPTEAQDAVTKAYIDALIAEAVAGLQSQIDDLESDQAVNVTEDAIAFYSFNNDASDITSNGYNGNSTNINFSYADRFQNPNGAAWFDSANSLITVDNFDYSFGSEISISFWMKYEGFDDGPQNNIALFNRRNGNNIDFDLSFTPDDNMSMHLGISSEIGPNVNNPSWKHYVITFDGNTLNYYIDNQLTYSFDVSNNGIITNVDNVLEIGQYNDMGGSIGFQGALDDLGFWNKVLTEQEINILFSNQFD
jgi:hypothetical protein